MSSMKPPEWGILILLSIFGEAFFPQKLPCMIFSFDLRQKVAYHLYI